MKNILFTVFMSAYLISCKPDKNTLVKLEGNAQGTTYHITYLSKDGADYKTAIDSLLKDIDSSMSLWQPASLISRINNNESEVTVDQYFIDVFIKSMEVSEKTEGLFDVTVGPLINSWGFGSSRKETMESQKIDSILGLVGYKMLKLEDKKIMKLKPQIKLDFNAIAQGYSVDVLSSFLESQGITDYLVELGGEVRTKGKKDNDHWKVGIDKPEEKNTSGRPLEAVINLKDRALATSGNYRKFYEEDGQKFSHIINPKTGYPAKQNLLSATVLANDCMTADAYATAFMVMGLEQSIRFLQDHKDLNLEVFFVYDKQGIWKTYASESLKKSITELF